jgi:hypothetical protein
MTAARELLDDVPSEASGPPGDEHSFESHVILRRKPGSEAIELCARRTRQSDRKVDARVALHEISPGAMADLLRPGDGIILGRFRAA